MRVIQNQPMIRQLSQNLVQNEMSNVALVLQSPTILTTYYSIESDLSEVIPGYRSAEDFIKPGSSVFYSRIEKFPMSGVDNLLIQSQFEDDVAGYDEDFTASAVIYPNTILPKPNDCFTIDGSAKTALYVVTDMKRASVRSNPFVEITFRLKSRNPDTIRQLEHQVRDEKIVCMNPLSENRSLVIAKKAKESIGEHLDAYLETVALYELLFYDRNKSAFVFDGFPSVEGRRRVYIDMTLWRFLFDEGIVIFDDLVTYANSNGIRNVERLYTGCPDIYIEDYDYYRSILYRVYHRESTPAVKRSRFDEYRFPEVYEAPSQIAKYQGTDIWYLETYRNHPDPGDKYGDFQVWDDDFLCRIRRNDPYPEEDYELRWDICAGCERPCGGTPIRCFNPYLRNAIIRSYNGDAVDWASVQVSDEKTVENYYLIPVVLGFYKRYIQGLA